jgi:pyruvate,orthophosphate dikinase
MLGLRGARLCVTYPQIMDMQVRAIVEAAIECRRARVDACPEIMLALIGTDREMRMVRAMVQKTIDETRRQQRFVPRLDIPIGAMIEVPRAAVTADRIADYADFFSFGTNDLTQMTFGYSRDDTGTFLPAYLAQEVLARDPFQSLDVEGVGRLMTMAVVRGRSSRPGLKCGICGPHGGDVSSIGFCHEIGLDYVSCRPLRLPVARLAAAQAALKGR